MKIRWELFYDHLRAAPLSCDNEQAFNAGRVKKFQPDPNEPGPIITEVVAFSQELSSFKKSPRINVRVQLLQNGLPRIEALNRTIPYISKDVPELQDS